MENYTLYIIPIAFVVISILFMLAVLRFAKIERIISSFQPNKNTLEDSQTDDIYHGSFLKLINLVRESHRFRDSRDYDIAIKIIDSLSDKAKEVKSLLQQEQVRYGKQMDKLKGKEEVKEDKEEIEEGEIIFRKKDSNEKI